MRASALRGAEYCAKLEEEEAFQSTPLFFTPRSPPSVVFYYFLHRSLLLFFPSSTLFLFFFFSFGASFSILALSVVSACCTGARVDRFSSGRSGGRGQHLQHVGQKAEAAQLLVETHQAAGTRRPCRTADNHDLVLKFGKYVFFLHMCARHQELLLKSRAQKKTK